VPALPARFPTPVLLLLDVLGGGTGTIVQAVANRWDRGEWAARLMTLTAPDRIETDLPLETLPPLSRASFYPVGQIRRVAMLARRLREMNPAIVHAYFFWSILYARLLKLVGVVAHVVENREDQGFNWGWHEYALLRLTAKVPDRVVCVSNAVRDVVLAREWLDPRRVVVIPNGIEVGEAPVGRSQKAAALKAELGFAPEHQVVGMVANLNRLVKGVGYFIESVPIIVAAVPETRFMIVGGGHGEESHRARARELGVEDRVLFVGFRPDIARYYEVMDISVLTSLSEGLSMTLLESMRHALPVVATRVGGNPELVEHGGSGYLVPPRDPRAFAGRVIELLRNQALRRTMGDRGRRIVEKRFPIDATSRAYSDLYREVLKGAVECWEG
jgi:L-malate glycosyltransferase